MRIAQLWGFDPVVIRKTWTIYDVANAHEALDLAAVADKARAEVSKQRSKR